MRFGRIYKIPILTVNMGSLSNKQWQALFLIIAALLIWAPVPVIPKLDIAGILVIIVAIWIFVK